MEKDPVNPELTRIVGKLVELGKERGYVTYEEVNQLIPHDEFHPDELKKAVTLLTDNDIELVEGYGEDEPVVTAPLVQGEEAAVEVDEAQSSDQEPDALFDSEDDEWALEEATETQTPEIPIPIAKVVPSVKPAPASREYGSDSTDPVRMYLQEMGSVPLLSREQEVTIAKEIEAGLHEVRDCVLALPVATDYIIGLSERIKTGEIEPRDVFSEDSEEDKVSSPERDEKKVKVFQKQVTVLKRLAKAYDANRPGRFFPDKNARAKRKPTAREQRFEVARDKLRNHLIE
ncbi:MAG: sigma-70 factor domain-containing protein, partial [Candidatus Binatia bacterium]